jgi:hypothetical protein
MKDGWTIAAYVFLVILIVLILVLLIVALADAINFSPPRNQYSTIVERKASTNRNSANEVDYLIYYRYENVTQVSKFPPLTDIKKTANDYLVASSGNESLLNWETVTRLIAEDIYANENVYGVTVEVKLINSIVYSFTKGYINTPNQQL